MLQRLQRLQRWAEYRGSLKWGNILHQVKGQYNFFPVIEKTVSVNATNGPAYVRHALDQCKVYE
jgi:hypothetical protein